MTDERVAVLETEVRLLKDDIEKMSKKVDELHALLLAARGIRWAIVVVASVIGFFGGEKIAKLFQ